MKKTIKSSFAILFAIITVLSVVSVSAFAYSTGTYMVNTSAGINVRSGPSSSYSKVGAASNGITFTVSKTSGSFGYASSIKCTNGYKSGWVCLDYCKQTSSSGNSRTTYNDVFASTKGSGYSVSQGKAAAANSFSKGTFVYVWGFVHDQNNNLYSSYSSGTCNMTLSIYRPNGNLAYSYSYKSSDNNWIGQRLDTTGTWIIESKITGSISGTNRQTIKCTNSTSATSVTTSGTVRQNVSKSKVTCNASSGSLPTSVSTIYTGDKVYFNFQVSSNLYVKTAKLYLRTPSSNSYSCQKTITANNYMRYDSADFTPLTKGTYYFYWKLTYTNGTTKTLSSTSLTVKAGSSNTKSINLNVPLYKQGDSRWSGTRIGTKTIGQVGCTLTCCAMIYSYKNSTTCYPNQMKNKLRFAGTNGNDLVWSSLSNVGLSYSKTYNCYMTYDMLQVIYNKLAAGKPVVVGCNAGNGGNQHWIVVKGFSGNPSSLSAANFTINDPGAKNQTTLKQFLDTHGTVWCFIY